MATDTTESRTGDLATLVNDIIRDAQELTRQQIELFKVEARSNFEKAKSLTALFAAGLAVAATASVVLAFAIAGWMSWAFPSLPDWGAQAIVGLILAVAAGVLFGVVKQQLTSFNLLPEKAVEAMKENLEWKTRPN
jgi:uncharacterized membrane protein YqjE